MTQSMNVALDLDQGRRKTKLGVKPRSKKKLATIDVKKSLKDNLLKEISSVQRAPKNLGLNRGMLLKSQRKTEEKMNLKKIGLRMVKSTNHFLIQKTSIFKRP